MLYNCVAATWAILCMSETGLVAPYASATVTPTVLGILIKTMGCGQSKINIYPRKSKGKNSNKQIASDKLNEDEEIAENEQELNSTLEECDIKKKAAKTKSAGQAGGPLLAQAELSSSQQNFFKMLDDKIQNGPDYDSNDETEIALETARLHTLLKDWETASASSRSLPTTPRHGQRAPPDRTIQSAPKPHSRIPLNVIHQTYGVTPQMPYRQQTNYNPTYQPHSPTHQPHYIPNTAKINPGIQYQDTYNTSYSIQQNYAVPRQYSMPNSIPNTVPSGSPTHYANNSPKRYGQGHHVPPNIGYVQNSPPHKVYVAPQNQGYSNGELIIQQQLYNQQIQYQQSREYQQYRQNREQLLVQQQICGAIPQGGYASHPTRGNQYPSNVHVPIVAVLPQNDQSPKMSLQRKQRQYSQEMT